MPPPLGRIKIISSGGEREREREWRSGKVAKCVDYCWPSKLLPVGGQSFFFPATRKDFYPMLLSFRWSISLSVGGAVVWLVYLNCDFLIFYWTFHHSFFTAQWINGVSCRKHQLPSSKSIYSRRSFDRCLHSSNHLGFLLARIKSEKMNLSLRLR